MNWLKHGILLIVRNTLLIEFQIYTFYEFGIQYSPPKKLLPWEIIEVSLSLELVDVH